MMKMQGEERENRSAEPKGESLALKIEFELKFCF
jgi:hypothetical protein